MEDAAGKNQLRNARAKQGQCWKGKQHTTRFVAATKRKMKRRTKRRVKVTET